MAAGKDTAVITVAYGPTGKSIGYDYLHNRNQREIQLTIHGNDGNCVTRVLLPPGVKNWESVCK
jgi:hypothetical protein